MGNMPGMDLSAPKKGGDKPNAGSPEPRPGMDTSHPAHAPDTGAAAMDAMPGMQKSKPATGGHR